MVKRRGSRKNAPQARRVKTKPAPPASRARGKAPKPPSQPDPPTRPPTRANDDRRDRTARPPIPTTIAAVGASAGGLEAFTALLEALPESPGIALVLVQHLSPQHESALPVLLGNATKLPVLQAAEGMRVESDHVYVIPPNTQMNIADGVLH